MRVQLEVSIAMHERDWDWDWNAPQRPLKAITGNSSSAVCGVRCFQRAAMSIMVAHHTAPFAHHPSPSMTWLKW